MKQKVVTVGLDLAKSVFQVHAIGSDGAVLVRRKLRRAEVIGFFEDLPVGLVGIKASASAHHWARELIALGHEIRLMPPACVKPDVKRGKTDAADAEAICEAVTRPTMRFVAVKAVDQQAVLMLHKSLGLMVRQRTMLIDALRGHLAEYGVVTGVDTPARSTASKRRYSCGTEPTRRADGSSQYQASVRSPRPQISTAVPDASLFRSGRQFASWLGLTPRAKSSGGKERMGGITKQGDRYMRRLLVVGATAVMRMARKDAARQPWLAQLVERKPAKIAMVALANETARIAWAVMSRNEVYAASAA
ncbi:transposase [Sphingomonas sp. T1]|nr:transposase [Sphingomonas sp. T1]